MTQIRHLRLVLPGALAQLRQQQERDQALSPLWQHTLRRAAWSRLWQPDDPAQFQLEAWQHSLLHALPAPIRHYGLASAALCWHGSGGESRTGTWLHAEWVHMAAGMDDVRLSRIEALDEAAEAELLAAIRPVLSMASFDWLTARQEALPLQHFLWCERPLDLVTHAPRQGFTTRSYSVMPQGAHGGQLRRIMTELQMVLHPHPLNARRERQGRLPVNALWLWGAGRLEPFGGRLAQRVLAQHPYVVGLAEHLNQACWPVPDRAQDLLALHEQDVMLVLPEYSLERIESDWLAPLQQGVERGAIGTLDLHLDHWRVSQRGGRWPQLRRYLAGATHELGEILA